MTYTVDRADHELTEKGAMDRRETWVMCSRTISIEVRCWPEAAPIRAECRRNRPVVKFWSTLLHSKEFTVDCIATFFVIYNVDSVSTIHRKESRDLLPPAAQGYKYWPQGQGPQRGRDQFDANAYGLAEIRSTSTPTACRRSRGHEEKPTTCEGCRDDIITEFQGVLCAVVAGKVGHSVVESIVRSDARCLRPVSVFASMKKIGTDPGRKHHERRDIISFFHALLCGCIPGRDHSR